MAKMKYFCILGGGGIRGMAYIGALKALEELKTEFTGFAGSSVGAVIAALYAIGYDHNELNNIFMDINLELFKDINFNFSKEFAISKGEHFLEWIRDYIEKKYYGNFYQKGKNEPVKFKDIKTDLVILSIDLTNAKYHEFSRQCTPEVEIAYAVRASVSMPGLFKPVLYEDKWVVDGDLIKSWPLWRISKNLCPENTRILEFRLEDIHSGQKINNSLEYLNVVYNVISGFATDFIIDLYQDKDKFDYIKLNSNNVSVLDFMISKERKKELADLGYETTMEYYKNKFPKKQKKLYENYDTIFKFLNKMKNQVGQSCFCDAYMSLGELFFHLSEKKRFIDILIYQDIIKYKNKFSANYKTSWFWHHTRLEKRAELRNDLDEIIKNVQIKLDELQG